MATAYILNVWDETQSKYVGIPAIKGDKGDKGDTPVIPIANEAVLGLVTAAAKTDDMIEEVGVDTNGKLWIKKIPKTPELILSATLPERVKSATFATDNGGNTFELKYIELEIVFPARVSYTTSDYYWDYLLITIGNASIEIDGTILSGSGQNNSRVYCFCKADVESNVGVFVNGDNICGTFNIATNVTSIDISINTNRGSDAYVPKDTKITLRGIRA